MDGYGRRCMRHLKKRPIIRTVVPPQGINQLANPAAKEEDDANLWRRPDTGNWYYIKMVKGKREKVNLETKDLAQAIIAKRQYLAMPVDPSRVGGTMDAAITEFLADKR